jgi:hypothetical protein
MTPRRALPPLYGTKEASEALGVSTGNLYQLAGLPQPAAQLACGKIWLASEIEAFAKARKEKRS